MLDLYESQIIFQTNKTKLTELRRVKLSIYETNIMCQIVLTRKVSNSFDLVEEILNFNVA